MMKVVQITTDNREHFGDYANPAPYFGTAPQALLQGFALLPGVDVHVVSCVQKPVESPEKLADNIFYHSLVVPKIGWLRTGYQGCIRAVRGKLKEIQPNIVHGQGTERECAISAVFSGFPNVVTIHGNMAELARLFYAKPLSYNWLAGRLENFALSRTRGVFCNSGYTKSLVEGRTKKTWFVPNPIRKDFFENISPLPPIERKLRLLNIGVVTQRKRQVEIIESLRPLRDRIKLVFVGTADASEYSQRFLSYARDPQNSDWLSYLGPLDIDGLLREIDQSHGLLHFPIEESFGLVAAEVLARGRILVASRTGGLCDICADVPGAYLVNPADFSELKHTIAGILRGDSGVQTNPQIMAERYYPEVIAKRHIEIYREVLKI